MCSSDLKGEVRIELPVIMTCSTCSITLDRSLRALDGVSEANVNYALQKAFVTYDPARITIARLVKTIRDAGYEVGAEKVSLKITGMTCASCVTKIEDALKACPGVIRADVNLGSSSANIEYLPSMTDMESLGKSIEIGRAHV